MTTHQNLPEWNDDDDAALLSAYIDGALSSDETAQLEARLNDDPALRAELRALRYTVALLNDLPELQAPRDFTLSAEQAAARRSASADDTETTPSNVTQLPTRTNNTNWTVWGSLAATFLVVFIGVSVALTSLDAPFGTPSAQEVAQQPTATASIAVLAPESADDDAAAESTESADINNNMGGASAESAAQNQSQRSVPAGDANPFIVQATQSAATSTVQDSSAGMSVPQSTNRAAQADSAAREEAEVAEIEQAEALDEAESVGNEASSAPQSMGATGDVAADEAAAAPESDAADSAEFSAPSGVVPQSAEPAPQLPLPELVEGVSLSPVIQSLVTFAQVIVQILVALFTGNGA